ncbi:MAG: AAA-like domain-containing protein [Crocosphaera sp.]
MASLSYYKVGGSLKANHPTYVFRKADQELLEKLLSKNYSCVFNSRQMGKSSLRIQTMKSLRKKGIKCVSIDLTIFGSYVSQEEWYRGLAYQILVGFDLETELNFDIFWNQEKAKTKSQKLLALFDFILEQKQPEDLVIFIDEIDSLINLEFKDDIFALIRLCYNLRAENDNYNRLTFCLLGVATPSDLIEDKTRTPFNITYLVRLTGFTFEESKAALLPGLTDDLQCAESILKQILGWTGGQPFLTQKLCRIVQQKTDINNVNIDELVKESILDNWEFQDQPEHLKTIRDRLLNDETKAIQLLGLYQEVLLSNTNSSYCPIKVDNSLGQVQLRLSGIVGIKDNYLQVYNPIYEYIFNLDWVKSKLANLRPYAAKMNAWVESNYNSDYLLQGETLDEVIKWSDNQKLSSIDYQFITASQQFFVKKETLEKEAKIKANLLLQQANKKARRLVLGGSIFSIFSLFLVVSSIIFVQYQRKKANLFQNKAKTIQQSYNTEQQFNSQPLEGLLSGIKAGESLENLVDNSSFIEQYKSFSPVLVLLKILSEIKIFNQVQTNIENVRNLQFSPQGDLIAVSGDNDLIILSKSGKIIQRFSVNIENEDSIKTLQWSKKTQHLLIITAKGKIMIWDKHSDKLKSLTSYKNNVLQAKISPDGQTIAIITSQNFIEVSEVLEVWKLDKTLKKEFSVKTSGVTTLNISPDNRIIAIGNEDGRIQLLDSKGRLKKTLSKHEKFISKISFSPDNQMIATGSDDGIIKLWDMDGKLKETLEEHQTQITDIRFHTNSKLIASSSDDKAIKVWKQEEKSTTILSNYNIVGTHFDFSPDGNMLVSGTSSKLVKFWKLNQVGLPTITVSSSIVNLDFDQKNQQIIISDIRGNISYFSLANNSLQKVNLNQQESMRSQINQEKNIIATVDDFFIKLWTLKGELIKEISTKNSFISSLTFHPKEKIIAIGTDQEKIELLDFQGNSINVIPTQPGWITSLSFHPQKNIIASGDENGIINLWTKEGKLLKSLNNHQQEILDLTFSPDGQYLVSASKDTTLNLWTVEGEKIKTLSGHTQDIYQVVFNPNSSIIASGDAAGVIKLWDKEGTPLITLKASKTKINSLRFTEDGLNLISGDNQGVVIVWPLQIQTLLNQSCRWLDDYWLTHPQQLKEEYSRCTSPNQNIKE